MWGYDMFDTYDTTIKKFLMKDHAGRELEMTTQELYEFYIFNSHGWLESFSEILRKLDNGQIVTAQDNEFDWDIGYNVYKGQVTFRKVREGLPKGATLAPKPPVIECSHKNKYINTAGLSRFWVCPDCKKDLGDAK